MPSKALYNLLVPDAPLHRRTEGDEHRVTTFTYRVRRTPFLFDEKIVPGLQTPELISSYSGTIDRILFSFPAFSAENSDLSLAYQSVINALRKGTQFIAVHHESVGRVIQEWFTAAGHPIQNVLLIPLPDYVSLTDWAEDAYVSLKDSTDNSLYLMEPWEFPRAGDALIADAVEEATDIKASQSPLIFQGGNCLIGDSFWLLGKDYFADTLQLLQGPRPPAIIPEGQTVESFAKKLFTKYVDSSRKLILIGSRKAIPIRELIGTKSDNDFFIDIATSGVGTFQPIFHIDMLISLVGMNAAGKFEILVGSPSLADKMLGTHSPVALSDVYDTIAAELEKEGFSVKRNPLVHRPSVGKAFKLAELKNIATQPGNESLGDAVKELVSFGANDSSTVKIRDWHHITWNNCLVENSKSKGKNVYLPTFGYGQNADLELIDREMKSLWESFGFTVHLLGDFNKFAQRQGVVHCIKKYITRGD